PRGIRRFVSCPRLQFNAPATPDTFTLSLHDALPIFIPCNLCGSQPNLQRQVIKEMLQQWDRQYPGRIETMFSALQNIVPSHLCEDRKSTRLNSSHVSTSYAVFCLNKEPKLRRPTHCR